MSGLLTVQHKIDNQGVYVHVMNYEIMLQNIHKYHNGLTVYDFYIALYLFL